MNKGPEVKLSVCLRERDIHCVRLGKNIRREKKGVFLIKPCWEWFAPGKLSYCENWNSRSSQLCSYWELSPVASLPSYMSCLCYGPVLSSPRDGSQELSSTPSCMWVLERAYPLEPGYITRSPFHSFSLVSSLWAVEELLDTPGEAATQHKVATGAGDFL